MATATNMVCAALFQVSSAGPPRTPPLASFCYDFWNENIPKTAWIIHVRRMLIIHGQIPNQSIEFADDPGHHRSEDAAIGGWHY